ncbi:F-box/FBD/LRR-repeat protein at3g52680 [Phtheirospermum japonicum]|uniref:F-box/FBD/LRR-repeat protein at3g52680 n=1 Tax=Phtheirospermum japonicum TaxID=374723 RepID=A0A830CN60_9LAMI|nr:F-box/FBD/LRR-repeat protein at3g52680 [Phtheirospermum japonicum]
MERARKSSKKHHNVLDDKQNVDRLSALPDGVISHILSFLPTQLSVKTSILATRWRFMWARVPVLDLEGVYGSSQTTSFPGIVCTVMLRHKAVSLNTFRLSYMIPDGPTDDDDGPMSSYELETCIATAIERNVKNLDLNLEVELPRCVLTCKTLVDFRMAGRVTLPCRGPISLSSLKKLHFYNVPHEVDLSRLLAGCPVLDELTIYQSPGFELDGCTISSPTLKRLTIKFSSNRVKIYAPALRYLKVFNCKYEQISVSLMKSLIEADIYLYAFAESDHRCVLKFLDSLCNVKCLKLSTHYGKTFSLPVTSSIVKFGSLTKLELSANWCFLTKFLESADHLRVLIISECHWHSEHWMDPIGERCACLFHSLRSVTIYEFQCTEQDFNMVRFVLRNAQVLERMEISCPREGVDLKKKFDAIQRISLFRRGSKECELAFS